MNHHALLQKASEVLQQLVSPTHADSLGQIGDYKLEQLIGAGSTGVVFRALDTNLNRPVALKVLRPSLGDSARRRFVTEAQAVASVEHDNRS